MRPAVLNQRQAIIKKQKHSIE